MKILLIGATGNIGQRILNEALNKGYSVTAAQRNPEILKTVHPNLKVITGDLLNSEALPLLLDDQDIIISALSPVGGLTPETFKHANQNLIAALSGEANKRVIVVGGAGSTEITPGVKLMHSPAMEHIPEEWKPAIFAHAEVLELYKNSSLNWTYFSPANYIEPGERTGSYRLGTTNMIFDANGKSSISYEDYAMALVDEIKNEKFLNQQFTIGY